MSSERTSEQVSNAEQGFLGWGGCEVPMIWKHRDSLTILKLTLVSDLLGNDDVYIQRSKGHDQIKSEILTS